MYKLNLLCRKDFIKSFKYIRIYNNIQLYNLYYTFDSKNNIKKLIIDFSVKDDINNDNLIFIINELKIIFQDYCGIYDLLKLLNIDNIKKSNILISEIHKELTFTFTFTIKGPYLLFSNKNLSYIIFHFINPSNNILFDINRGFLYNIFGLVNIW